MSWVKRIKWTGSLVWETVIKFYEGNMLSYSASIAFFMIFSFPGVFMVVVIIAGFFFNENVVRQELFDQITRVVGPESGQDINKVILNISKIEHTFFASLVGIATILFGATSVFASIQDGLNVAWELRPKSRRFALKLILNRLLSFALVLSIGFIMLVSLLVDAILVLFRDFLAKYLEGGEFQFIEAVNEVFSTTVIAVIFLLVYRFLPNGRVKWKFLIPGSLISMLLFILGKYLIGIYLGNSSVGTAYGAAGSLVVLLIWVYYSSIVLLFGAQLIEELVKCFGSDIIPDSGTVKIVTRELESD